jgi:hypothetical protein
MDRLIKRADETAGIRAGASDAIDPLTVMVRVAEPVPSAFVALMMTLEVPATVGVPLMTPVLVFTPMRPAGRPVAL